jgi:hypothetical protein
MGFVNWVINIIHPNPQPGRWFQFQNMLVGSNGYTRGINAAKIAHAVQFCEKFVIIGLQRIDFAIIGLQT